MGEQEGRSIGFWDSLAGWRLGGETSRTMLYRSVVRPLLFRLDAETAHHTTFALLRAAACVPGVMPLLRLWYGGLPTGQERTIFGLKFANAVGLAAGLDKDAMINHHWEAFGFGHMEIGTVTPRPQPGNDRPRLFRLPAEQQDSGSR